MLYLISGASRSGKTMIAEKILARKNLPYVSLDWLVMGFTNGMPECGIHDLLFPDEIAKKLWGFLQAMCESMLFQDVDCVIEGEAVLPELVSELLKKHPDKIKICFLGYTDIEADKKADAIKEFSTGITDWLSSKPDEYIIDHINNMVVHSRMIKAGCKKFSIRYFDTSKDFIGTVDKAMEYLMET
jgi:2-phosphoglycerate kinase